jgi:hypothetical protein
MAISRTCFKPGVSGNPGGRPKGSKTYSVRRLVAEALEDPATRRAVVEELKRVLVARKTLLSALEFAAKVNREVGLGAGEVPGGVTIMLVSNIEPGKFRSAAGRALPLEAQP